MAQNQLPFETQERQRYGASLVSVRLELLEKCQLSTFRRAAEIIFLTNITRQIVKRRLGPLVKQGLCYPRRHQPRLPTGASKAAVRLFISL